MIENYDEISKDRHLKLLSNVQSDAQWLTRMVENLLSVTRVDADKVRLTKNSTVLEELIDSLLVKFHKHYPQQAVHIQIPESFVSIPMDAMLIEQVLMNLLENAVFHAKGMENLWLTVQIKNGEAVFTVADDGCGIGAERLETLFSGNPATNNGADTGRSNMGIGLSVCAAIVRAHGGSIWAENRPEGGARFCFTLKTEDGSYGE
jgi:two-component system sensor histidine kinase KdpD